MFYQQHHLGSSEHFCKETGENFSFPLHLHQCFELIVVEAGEMCVTVDTVEYRLGGGEALLVFPNQLHSLSSDRSRHTLLIFSPKLVEAYSAKRRDLLPADNRVRLDVYLREQLCALSAEGDKIRLKGLLYLLCAQMDEKAVYRSAAQGEEPLLAQIFRYVDTHFQGMCSLEKLARQLGYNYTYLSRYFKKTVGIAYNEYVNLCRVNHAGHLLRDTTLSVLDCACESGYVSLRSFNRNFKAVFGMTPTDYRESR